MKKTKVFKDRHQIRNFRRAFSPRPPPLRGKRKIDGLERGRPYGRNPSKNQVRTNINGEATAPRTAQAEGPGVSGVAVAVARGAF